MSLDGNLELQVLGLNIGAACSQPLDDLDLLSKLLAVYHPVVYRVESRAQSPTSYIKL